jgi:hypothetical protein
MLLEHPSLEPFEPLIGWLFDLTFGNALRELAKAGFGRGVSGHLEPASQGRIEPATALDINSHFHPRTSP